ncbi:MAG: hypothetical protein R3B57_06195 [Phycisphaerales bacterium]
MTKMRRRRLRAPGSPRCVCCGYSLEGLKGWTCPECATTSDPRWYEPPLAAGSRRRKYLVRGGLINIWLHTAMIVLAWTGFVLVCRIPSPAAPCPVVWICVIGLAGLTTFGVAVWATLRRHRLRWGHRRGVIVLFAYVIFNIFALGGACLYWVGQTD